MIVHSYPNFVRPSGPKIYKDLQYFSGHDMKIFVLSVAK